MRQFKQLGWIRQGVVGVVLFAVMAHGNAMSVRERYLQQHPVAKTEDSPAKKSTHHGKHHKLAQPIVKHSHVHQAKNHHQRVIVPKHTKSKFDKQQAHDAEAALKHHKVKQEAHVSHHQHHVAPAPIAKHHATHHPIKHPTHHKRHHAE